MFIINTQVGVPDEATPQVSSQGSRLLLSVALPHLGPQRLPLGPQLPEWKREKGTVWGKVSWVRCPAHIPLTSPPLVGADPRCMLCHNLWVPRGTLHFQIVFSSVISLHPWQLCEGEVRWMLLTPFQSWAGHSLETLVPTQGEALRS